MKKIILICLLLVGCGGYWSYLKVGAPEHVVNKLIIPVMLDAGFSAVEEKSIYAAMSEWNVAFNGQVEFRVDGKFERDPVGLVSRYSESGNGLVIVKMDDTDRRLAGTVESGDGVLAFVPRMGGHLMVVIGNRISTYNLRTIVLHEIGHLMGAYHVNGDNLMNPHYGPKQIDCIDKVTAMQVAAYNDLDFGTMRYCRTKNFE